MAEQIPLALIAGKISQIGVDDTLRGDFLSGTDLIALTETKTIPLNRQSINFTQLTIDGVLVLNGDLWLA